MTFKRAADGVAQHGKTKGKNLGNSGPSVGTSHGGKGGFAGKSNEDMKAMGRNLAKVAAQKRG